MGGSLFMIPGSLVPERLVPREEPATSFLGRLFGRTRTVAPDVFSWGEDTERVRVPCAELQAMSADFVAWARARMPSPSPSSEWVFDAYLHAKPIQVHMDGERPSQGGGPATWHAWLGFSGYAGMAEISALVAAHWAERWWREERVGITERYFAPFGFTPAPELPPAAPERFVPAGAWGYGLVLEGEYARRPDDGPEDPGALPVEVDASALEALDEPGLARLRAELEGTVAAARGDRRCRCQLCASA